MFNKKVISALFALAFVAGFALNGYAQSAQVHGEVKLKKADGTEVPLEGALVEAYRTDTSTGKLPATKTNSKGEFTFPDVKVGNVYAITVSAPGVGPKVTPDIKAGGPKVVVIVEEGDGSRVEEGELRELISKAAGMSEEDRKKADAEYQKQLEKYNEEKAKAENTHKIVSAALADGDKAFNAKNYDLAITNLTKA